MHIKNIVIGIAVIILTIFVVVYGIGTVYLEPEYSDFCDGTTMPKEIGNETSCIDLGGIWVSSGDYCNIDYYACRDSYDSAREVYSRNLFLVCLPLGILIIVLGAMVFGLEAVGSGLMGGGIGAIIYGAGSYWEYSGELLKFLLSLAGLVAVIWFAYWWNKKSVKRKK